MVPPGESVLGGLLTMNVKSIEKNGNQATIIVDLDDDGSLIAVLFNALDIHG